MFNRYYQEELAYLRDMGREFSQAMPEAARFLGEAGTDPDVERILEGFAFLTARIRQKLDDEVPELTHAVLEMLAPHYLQPTPPMTVMSFEPTAGALQKPHTVPRGSEVASKPVEGTACLYRVAYDTELVPLKVTGLEVRRESPRQVRLRFEPLPGAKLEGYELKKVRLFLTGDSLAARSLYMCLCRYFESARVNLFESAEALSRGLDEDATTTALPQFACRAVGLEANEAMLGEPKSAFPGMRLLREYFAFPQKFLFVDLEGFEPLEFPETFAGFDLVLNVARFPEDMPPVSAHNVALNCAPAINLFTHQAVPISLDFRQREYRVRPAGDINHYEIQSVEEVHGTSRATNTQRAFRPLFDIALDDPRKGPFYLTRRRFAMTQDATEVWIAFLGSEVGPDARTADGRLRLDEVISLELTCSNRLLSTKLSIGDICEATETSPKFARFKNITRPTATIPPPLEGDDFWRLIAHLAVHHQSLLQPQVLRGLLTLYNFPARVDRQAELAHKRLLEGIAGIEASPQTRLLDGSPVRGIGVTIELHEDGFGSEGDLYLFGTVLNAVLAHGVTLNSFHHLTVHGTKFGETHAWPATIGNHPPI